LDSKPQPKRHPGRPPGTTKGAAKRSETFSGKISPAAKQWLNSKPRGWLADWIESQAEQDAQKKPCQ